MGPGQDDRAAALSLLQGLFESGGDPGEPELQGLCEAHPELAEELRAGFAELDRVRDLIDLPARSILAELRARHGDDVDTGLALEPTLDSTRWLPPGLADRDSDRRYHLEGELGRGGGGVVFEVRDDDLRRRLAMKVAIAGIGSGSNASTLARFLEEAQVTGQLDHPGVVPLHELGLDAKGRVYFTMRLVRGRDLREIFELVREGKEDWNRTRALGALLKVCETMAFAHSKGVMHRDLKPANVMVGRFGEVYVMDWGLAKIQGREDTRDLRPKPEEFLSSVHTARRDESDSRPDSPLVTMDGTVVGTPAYMPPEQAEGRIDALGAHSDVYSLGAMLYHLLSGHAPYWNPDARMGAYTILALVVQGAPPRLHKVAPGVPAELVSICEKAMAREPEQRYPNTMALAEDLRAYLEGRVVAAYEAGALAELRKWVGRNRGLAAASILAVLALVVGTLVSNTQRTQARARTQDVLRLADARRLEELQQEAEVLWPAHPEHELAYVDWLRRADELLARVPDHRRTLAELAGRGQRVDEEERARRAAAHPRTGHLATLERRLAGRRELLASENLGEQFDSDPEELRAVVRDEIAALENRIGEVRAEIDVDVPEALFEADEDSWWYSRLAAVVRAAEAMSAPDGTHADVTARFAFARDLSERSITGEEAAALWTAAIDSIADPEECPAYEGLRIAPQMGLLPLGRDRNSGLWEFAHLYSGAPASRDELTDELTLGIDSGIVLVLLPGGLFDMGAQAHDAVGRGYDARAEPDEGPVRPVALAPFFLSKFELTQSQWQHATGANPSVYVPGFRAWVETVTALHPVEGISWFDARRFARHCGLTVPTEAQWEYGARAGTTTRWWTGDEDWSVDGVDNLPDPTAKTYTQRVSATWNVQRWTEVEDGYVLHAPVDAYEPNPFGLYGVLGNVAEWCRDAYGRDYRGERTEGEGELLVDDDAFRMYRGGAFILDPRKARSANRESVSPDYANETVGVRLARSVDP